MSGQEFDVSAQKMEQYRALALDLLTPAGSEKYAIPLLPEADLQDLKDNLSALKIPLLNSIDFESNAFQDNPSLYEASGVHPELEGLLQEKQAEQKRIGIEIAKIEKAREKEINSDKYNNLDPEAIQKHMNKIDAYTHEISRLSASSSRLGTQINETFLLLKFLNFMAGELAEKFGNDRAENMLTILHPRAAILERGQPIQSTAALLVEEQRTAKAAAEEKAALAAEMLTADQEVADAARAKLEQNIALASDIFQKHGKAVNPPKSEARIKLEAELKAAKPLSEVKAGDPKAGDVLKKRIHALETTKYKPPLSSVIEGADGKKVRFTVKSGEGDLKEFPIDFKKSLQIRALQHTRAGIELMRVRMPNDPEIENKAIVLEKMADKWIREWNGKRNGPIPTLEAKVERLEKEIAEMKVDGKNGADLKNEIASCESIISTTEAQIRILQSAIYSDKMRLKNIGVLGDRSRIRLKESIKAKKQEIADLQNSLLPEKQNLSNCHEQLSRLHKASAPQQKELAKTRNALFAANDEAFHNYLEKLTVAVGSVVDTNNFADPDERADAYKQVFKELDEVEAFVTWQDDRIPIVSSIRHTVFVNGEAKEELHVQMEDPYHALTDAQIAEFKKVFDGQTPEWFKALPKEQQKMLRGEAARKALASGDLSDLRKAIYEDISKESNLMGALFKLGKAKIPVLTSEQAKELNNKFAAEPQWLLELSDVQQKMLNKTVEQAFSTGDLSILEKTIPSVLRQIPGGANFTKATSLTLVEDEKGEFTAKDGQPYRVTSVHNSTRMSTPLAVTMKASEAEKQNIADQNAEQMMEAVAGQTAKEYLKHWGLEEGAGSRENPVRVPISLPSLLTSLGNIDNETTLLGMIVPAHDSNNNRAMILAKLKAIEALKTNEKYSGSVNVGTKENPRYVQYDFIGQNHKLSGSRAITISAVNDDPTITGENQDLLLLQSFARQVERINNTAGYPPLGNIASLIKEVGELENITQDQITALKNNLRDMKADNALGLKEQLYKRAKEIIVAREANPGEITPERMVKIDEEAHNIALAQAQNLLMAAEASVQLAELKQMQKEKPVIPNQPDPKGADDRNRELFCASLSSFIVSQMKGVNDPACKSSNDRRGLLENVHVAAMQRIFARTGRLPRYDDPPHLREAFVNEMELVLKGGFANQTIDVNALGTFGAKNEKVPIFGQLWPADLAKRMKKNEFGICNNRLCKLNAVASKENSLDTRFHFTVPTSLGFLSKPGVIVASGLVSLIVLGVAGVINGWVTQYANGKKQAKRYKSVMKEAKTTQAEMTTAAALVNKPDAVGPEGPNEESVATLAISLEGAAKTPEEKQGLVAVAGAEPDGKPGVEEQVSPVAQTDLAGAVEVDPTEESAEELAISLKYPQALDAKIEDAEVVVEALEPDTKVTEEYEEAEAKDVEDDDENIDLPPAIEAPRAKDAEEEKAAEKLAEVPADKVVEPLATKVAEESIVQQANNKLDAAEPVKEPLKEKATPVVTPAATTVQPPKASGLPAHSVAPVFSAGMQAVAKGGQSIAEAANKVNVSLYDRLITLEEKNSSTGQQTRIINLSQAKKDYEALTDAQKTPKAIAAKLVDPYGLEGSQGSALFTTKSKEPAAAIAAVNVLLANTTVREGVLSIKGGTDEQRIAACEEAKHLGFQNVTCAFKSSVDPAIQERIGKLGEGFVQHPPVQRAFQHAINMQHAPLKAPEHKGPELTANSNIPIAGM